MLIGISAGIAWALETVILGAALGMSPLSSGGETVFLAPFVATYLHDMFSAFFTVLYNILKGNFKGLLCVFKSKSFKWLCVASAIGGPVGMTGYVMAVRYMGASVGAVASAVYPAIGTVLAYFFLKERVKWYQWIFLILTLFGVYGLSYSPNIAIESFMLGVLGAFMCAFGWGIEAVILAKCLKDPEIKNEYALAVRQTISALIYGAVILPALGGWGLISKLFSGGNAKPILTVAAAAFCATVSYLFYYKTIKKVGAAKAMALNITYTAWSILFTVLILRDTSVLNPLTVICAAAVVVFGICAAADVKTLFVKKQKK